MMSPMFYPVALAIATGAASAAAGMWLASRILPPNDEDGKACFVISVAMTSALLVFFVCTAIVEG